ncbi:uncharacterized protein [Cherax quadricarinatus]|uniref:uncharacterized protein n=1 Tax=Cherax quadricarinatus TaxID=27406 RepID=UPI00387EC4A8
MKENDYQEKMNNLLDDTETYSKLRKNPLETVNSNFNKTIKLLLKGKDELVKQFTSTNPSLPYMYGLIKTHKPGNPVRPIISSIGSVSYKLFKWLVDSLSPIVGKISNFNVKNNIDLVDKLSSLTDLNDFNMVSFDVTSLFTKVPVDDLLSFLSEELVNYDLPLPVPTIIKLIKLCIVDTKFVFNDRFYTQKFGMAMGNPLSPVLSNLYMEFFETRLLNTILPNRAKWFRYVDDILCLMPKNVDIHHFLGKLNSLAHSINFTVQFDENNSLPFLDVLIIKGNNEFKFKIYRKPTNNCSYVHYYSSHQDRVKLSVFSSMFLRALRICSPEFIDEEISKIYKIGNDLKYPRNVIDKSFKVARNTFYNPKRDN